MYVVANRFINYNVFFLNATASLQALKSKMASSFEFSEDLGGGALAAAAPPPDEDSLSDLSLVEEEGTAPADRPASGFVKDDSEDVKCPVSPGGGAGSAAAADFRGFTPMEVETCRARKRPLLTIQDLEWEANFDLLSTIEALPSKEKPPRIRVKKDLKAKKLSASPLPPPLPPTASQAATEAAGEPEAAATMQSPKETPGAAAATTAVPSHKPHIPILPVSPPMMPAASKHPHHKKHLAAAAEPMMRESRGWKPSAQFFKPLAAGWKREVIYGKGEGQYYRHF